MFRELRASITLFLLFMFVTGLGYPMLTLYLGQALFPHQANGSLIEENGKIIGSTLIGQNFIGDKYFHPRPSTAGNGYDAGNSSGSNLGPTSADLLKAVSGRVADLKKAGSPPSIPVDLVTASGSGLDPHISPAAARFQAARVAEARKLDITKIEDALAQYTEPRTLGFLGENRVNVLELNRALDRPVSSPMPVSP